MATNNQTQEVLDFQKKFRTAFEKNLYEKGVVANDVHFQDYSSINLINKYQCQFNLKGGQMWVVFSHPDFPELRIELNIRNFERIDFGYQSRIPPMVCESVYGRLLISWDWYGICSYSLRANRGNQISKKKKELVDNYHESDGIAKAFKYAKHYELDDAFIEIFEEEIDAVRTFFETLTEDDLAVLKSMQGMKSISKFASTFKKHFKPRLKELFGKDFYIR